jgi:hypothetical protein
MTKTIAVLVVIATGAILLASGATAGSSAAKQRVAISGVGASGFTLTPLTAGALKMDAGSASFCCWTTRDVIRDGQAIEVTNGPLMTATGKNGALVAKNRMEWLSVSGGYEVFTGTWKVVRGTGAYAGLAGGGRVAGITLPGGETKWRREGLIGPS